MFFKAVCLIEGGNSMKPRFIRTAAIAVVLLMIAAVLTGASGAFDSSSTSKKNSKDGLAKSAEPMLENAWPTLSEEEQDKAIDGLKKFAEATSTQLDRPLKAFETRYFLFYSDLPLQEAQNWAGLLDRMYERLAELFAVPKGENVWVGKALVFVFSKADDYRRYEREMLHTDPGTTAGMCHSFGSGIVKIAFYRQRQELTFAHVLVHESVHGFVHRFRTPVPIPSWANEGLAETIATELVPQRGRASGVKSQAREELQLHQSNLGDFFQASHISAWQYPVAEELCTFMIQASKKNYVEFINGIKEGLTSEEALSKRYKAPRERLIPAFGQWLGVKQLQ
jgi:hypothetical protein